MEIGIFCECKTPHGNKTSMETYDNPKQSGDYLAGTKLNSLAQWYSSRPLAKASPKSLLRNFCVAAPQDKNPPCFGTEYITHTKKETKIFASFLYVKYCDVRCQSGALRYAGKPNFAHCQSGGNIFAAQKSAAPQDKISGKRALFSRRL